jgi:hypothetical protein
MSVWPLAPASLSSNEGELLLVSIAVEPRRLELLLETLAQLAFPVNPEIYHEASIVCHYPDGHQESETATLVEFPAYEVRLEEVRLAFSNAGFDPGCVRAVSMLDEIHNDRIPEPAARDSLYIARYRVKRRANPLVLL